MTKKVNLEPVQISNKIAFSNSKHQVDSMHNRWNRHAQLLNISGGTRKKRRGKKGGSKSCGCSGVPKASPTFIAGSSNNMSPNANDNILQGQQLLANTLCAGSLDNMGDSWSGSGGGKRKRRGGVSALGSFVESLNNMNGGKKRRRTKRKRRRKSRKKKRRSRKRRSRKRRSRKRRSRKRRKNKRSSSRKKRR
jgi:hypothetical protein